MKRVLAHTGACYPIVQAPMGWIARSALAGAVSRAGGLGGHPWRDMPAARCPVTLVRGGRSQLVNADMLDHAVTMAPPGTERLELPDADHHVMLDQPLAFAELLARLALAA